MSIITEYEHLMELSPGEGLQTLYDVEALHDRITEWFETPQGTIADLPAWGHNLSPFKHDPPGSYIEVMLEMAIVRKLPQDVKNLEIVALLVEYPEIDLCKITIQHRLATYEGEITIQ
jgi:phage baseplate assembly protein W